MENLIKITEEHNILGPNKLFFKHYDYNNILESWFLQRQIEIRNLISITLSKFDINVLPLNPNRSPSLMVLEMCSDIVCQFNGLLGPKFSEMSMDVSDLFIPFYSDIHIPE